MAYRYECQLKDRNGSGHSSFHSKGTGKPRGTKCSYCGGGLLVERGKWGVFVWDGRGNYRAEDAVKVCNTVAQADKLVYSDEGAAANWCVRWIGEAMEAVTPGARTSL
jgi:hypothetical protein